MFSIVEGQDHPLKILLWVIRQGKKESFHKVLDMYRGYQNFWFGEKCGCVYSFSTDVT